MFDLKERRLGKFWVTFAAIESGSDSLYDMMKNVVVIRAEALLHMKAVEYIAISKQFDIISDSETVPEYTGTFCKEDDNVFFDGFKKI